MPRLLRVFIQNYEHHSFLSLAWLKVSPFVLTGKIVIDGCDIRSIRLESLRRHVGLVSQDIVSDFLFGLLEPTSCQFFYLGYLCRETHLGILSERLQKCF